MKYYLRKEFKFKNEKDFVDKEVIEKAKKPVLVNGKERQRRISVSAEDLSMIVEDEIEKNEIKDQIKDKEAQKTFVHHCDHDEENRTGCKLVEVK